MTAQILLGEPLPNIAVFCNAFRRIYIFPREIAASFQAVGLLIETFMESIRRFVYVLKNAAASPHYYTGLTSDVAARLKAHNQRNGHHTSGRGPWHLDVVVEFADETRAVRFEKYLKSGSGGAFAKRHLR